MREDKFPWIWVAVFFLAFGQLAMALDDESVTSEQPVTGTAKEAAVLPPLVEVDAPPGGIVVAIEYRDLEGLNYLITVEDNQGYYHWIEVTSGAFDSCRVGMQWNYSTVSCELEERTEDVST